MHHGATGVILAGGGSTRFGSPKGLARVGGSRIIDRVAGALRAVAPELLLVANDPDAAAWLPNTPVAADVIPGAGALGGVHAALTHLRRPVIVVAWDMPFVSAPLLAELWSRMQREQAHAAVAESGSPVGLEPFCACYAPACLPALDAALRAGRPGGAQFVRSLARVAWLRRRDVRRFGNPTHLFLSVNTPGDLVRAEAIAGRTV